MVQGNTFFPIFGIKSKNNALYWCKQFLILLQRYIKIREKIELPLNINNKLKPCYFKHYKRRLKTPQ